MALEQQAQRKAGIAASEVVDEPVTLGLAEDRNDALWIDAAGGDRSLDAADVIRRDGGDAMNFCNRHGVVLSNKAARMQNVS